MFSIKEILPHVYHLHFERNYDLAMHFWRFQEYYESPKFHKKIVSLVGYMEWYAEKHGEGAFTYPKDWHGFNVPSWVLHQVRGAELPDPNCYDRFMFLLIDWMDIWGGTDTYYVIGTSTEAHGDEETEEDVLDHEIAHALYTVNPEYREKVTTLLADWNGPWDNPNRKRLKHDGAELDSARDVLKGMGYHPSTISDEVHAYCAAGLCSELEGVISEKEMKPFQKLFKEFKEKCKNDESK
jgi:hypothetical protein